MNPWGSWISFYIEDVNSTGDQRRHDETIAFLTRVVITTENRKQNKVAQFGNVGTTLSGTWEI